MGRISPYEEERMAHSYHNYSAIGFLALTLAMIAIMYTANDHRRYNVHITAQNFGWVFDLAVASGRSWDVSIEEVNYRHWDGEYEYTQLINEKWTAEEVDRIMSNPWAMWKYKQVLSEKDKNPYKVRGALSLVPTTKNYATFSQESYRTLFGQTDANLCHYPPGGRPEGLPSILRTFELSCAFQLFARACVLSTFYVRWYYAYLRCISVFNTKSGKIVRSLAFLTPKLQTAEMVFAFLITCFQQDNDAPLKWLFPFIIIAWAVAICAYMLVFTLMSLIDGGAESSSRLAQIRFACLSICVFCSPIWIKNHLPFIQWKTCFAEVPPREALSEYATVLAVIVFVVTQLYEMRNYWGLLSCSNHDYCVELNPEFEDTYRPAQMQLRPASVRNRLSSSSSRKSSDVFLL